MHIIFCSFVSFARQRALLETDFCYDSNFSKGRVQKKKIVPVLDHSYHCLGLAMSLILWTLPCVKHRGLWNKGMRYVSNIFN